MIRLLRVVSVYRGVQVKGCDAQNPIQLKYPATLGKAAFRTFTRQIA